MSASVQMILSKYVNELIKKAINSSQCGVIIELKEDDED